MRKGSKHTRASLLKMSLSKLNSKGMLGKKHTDATKKRIGEAIRGKFTGSDSHQWKGESVGYDALHKFVRKYFIKLKICSKCGTEKNVDLANITGIYNRDFSNWDWLCRKHHIESDGRFQRHRTPVLT